MFESMDRLAEIVETKRQRVAASKDVVSVETVEMKARESRRYARPRALRDALTDASRANIIAEFKRRSPSKGVIKPGADPAVFARQYESGGAIAISVLTEEDHFDGSLDDLNVMRQTTSLPILRKDFIFDEYQIYESAAAGADALLLIARLLDDDSLRRLRLLTEDELHMDALVEVHTRQELNRALDCGANLIGVNNRDLTTFEVSLETSIELARHAPRETLLISESGIETVDDVERLRAVGYRGFLIGESLMKAESPEGLLSEFSQSRQGAKTNALS